MEIIINLFKAFLVGGIICIIGQLLIDLTHLTPVKILVSFVIIGVVLGGIGLYEPIVKWAECGATIPLIGFGYGLADGTKKAISEDGLLGVLTGPLSSAAVGITGAVICGLLASVFTKPKEK